MEKEANKKEHRPRQAGTKKDKKGSKVKVVSKNTKENNPKAFAPFKGAKFDKLSRRNADLEQKKLHVPMVDRTPDLPAPMVVAVVGPPKSGKSTLIKSLVKRFTKHNLNEINGPITVISGKKRRLTFLECQNDINAMVDIGKVADLVLLMIDASYGFEMETFEFLNVLQAHGFPKVMGVLTHLDKFRDSKRLQTTKKTLKRRFWSEIYQGAKLFYLSGVINGRYPDREVHNLSRFISVMKFRPLIWRNSHPYMIADRLEDLTDPELLRADPKCDRTVTLYGYLRGTNMKTGSKVHIAGVGDFVCDDISYLNDPCPLPEKVRKSLSEKSKLIYAPMSDVGGIMFDKDAVYINTRGNFTKNDDDDEEHRELGEGEKMVMDLQDSHATLAQQFEEKEMRIFNHSEPTSKLITLPTEQLEIDEEGRNRRRAIFKNGELEISDNDDDENYDSDIERPVVNNSDDDNEEDVAFADSDSELGSISGDEHELLEDGEDIFSGEEEDIYDDEEEKEELDGELRWKDNLISKAKDNFYSSKKINLVDIIYNNKPIINEISSKSNNNNDDDDDEFFKPMTKPITADNEIEFQLLWDSAKKSLKFDKLDKWDNLDKLDSLRHRFITGSKGDGPLGDVEDDGSVYGDFEDLENNNNEDEKELSKEQQLLLKKEQLKEKFDQEFDNLPSDDEDQDENLDFYDIEKSKLAKQQLFNQKEFIDDDPTIRAQVEGYRPGTYVRMLFKQLPSEFIINFDPTYPIIIGGLLANESNFGLLRVRIKRHRWHKKILKTSDPLIFSIGWRRFQSMPIYSLNDGSRNRLLKYTPEHMHCLATFYGPVAPPNTGFCCFQSVSKKTSNFRVSATGVVLENDQASEIVKKLKLKGEPFKIYKNSAFIRNMFTSVLEVAKFEGATIRTVSGIRGMIKKHAKTPPGAFRATFEDKVLRSDIVFLRAWYPVKPKKYYNPVTSLLMEDKNKWTGMRIVADVRINKNLPVPFNINSQYRDIERKDRHFNKLHVPKKLIKELPFSTKPKDSKAKSIKSKPTYLQKRAVVMTTEQKKVTTLMQQLHTLDKVKQSKLKIKKAEDRVKLGKRIAEMEAKRGNLDKKARKEQYRKDGAKQKAMANGRFKGGNRNDDD